MKKAGLFLLIVLLISLVPYTEAAPIEIKYFYSTGCSHCKKTTPIIDEIEAYYGDIAHVERININVASNQEIWEDYVSRFSISGVPAVVINEERKLEGDIKITYDALIEIIDEMLTGIEIIGDELYAEGIDEMGSGKFEHAIELFNDAIDIYAAAGNQTKVNLCNLRIQESNNYILARQKFIEAENLYLVGDYESAKPVYQEIIDIYYDIGNEPMASISLIRLQSCNFFITYDKASSALDRKNYNMALNFYNEAKTYTSNKDTIDAINELIDFCESQISAQALYEQAEAALGEMEYLEAKGLYNDAALLFSDADKVLECDEKASLCDSYILAGDTYDYGVSLYEAGEYEQSKVIFANAMEIYSTLGETSFAAQCENYIAESQARLDEIEYQRQLEEDRRQHERFMKMVYVSAAAVCIIVFFSATIIYLRRRASSAALNESEHPAEDEDDEGEAEQIG